MIVVEVTVEDMIMEIVVVTTKAVDVTVAALAALDIIVPATTVTLICLGVEARATLRMHDVTMKMMKSAMENVSPCLMPEHVVSQYHCFYHTHKHTHANTGHPPMFNNAMNGNAEWEGEAASPTITITTFIIAFKH